MPKRDAGGWQKGPVIFINRQNVKNSGAMLNAPLKKLIPKMAVPTIVAQLITTIYNIVDAAFVSSLGTNAMAAVGVNSSLERTITLIGSLLGAGSCSYIARLLGEKRNKDADNVLSTFFLTGMALGTIILALGLIFLNDLVYLLGADANCAEYSAQYARYVLLAAPFMTGSFILNMCLRSEGGAARAMIGMGFGGILNCILDPFFIFDYGLGLGVAGASIATAISKFVSFAILIYPYLRRRCEVHISLKDFRYRWRSTKEVLAIGSTSFFRSAFGVVAGVIMNHVANGFSTAALAAISAANRVMEFPFAIVLGFGQGYQPVSGFNWGAKRFDRVREALRFSTAVSLVGAVLIGGALALFANPVISIFNKEADAAVQSIGVLCIRLQCLALPAHAWGSLINMFYASLGKARQALLVSTARQGYCLVPVTFILPRFFDVVGVAACQATADLLSLLVIIPLAVAAYKLITKAEEEFQNA